ncbi:hypothetical protein Micbo1qcDRAFT_209397 [Microdochium bolleyi]|uniref:Uncharacterized protein n=1 Tax=Microdochium bolleyi TaxID=196109 RepID=A0A136IMZ4_9PEZI|nr:hypothetical protein Micbo1qcDRAFT_209397 [Microdochium bolleyi]
MDDLEPLLTPELFRLTVASHLNQSRDTPIDFRKFIADIFTGEPGIDPAVLRAKTWPALCALSQIPNCHDPTSIAIIAEALSSPPFLPAPEDPEFPKLSLGLLLFLDQGPRSFCTQGADVRYTDGFFADIALHVARRLLLLPESSGGLPTTQRPGEWPRWQGQGVSADFFVLVRFMLGAVFVHHEHARDEARAFTEETRVWVEQRFGVTDPHREEMDKTFSDVVAFPQMVQAMIAGELPVKASARGGGGEEEEQQPMGVAEGFFFLALLYDVHYPLVDKFGRYPYRNGALGRLHTPEEEKWLAEQTLFKELPDDLRVKIREDVEAGRWTPLSV